MIGVRRSKAIAPEELLAVVEKVMREQGLEGEPKFDVPLDESGLGFDSMSRLDLLAAVEQGCRVAIPEKYWGGRQLKDLNDLMRVAVARK